MTWFCEKMLISNRCICGFMPKLHKKSWMVSTAWRFVQILSKKNESCPKRLHFMLFKIKQTQFYSLTIIFHLIQGTWPLVLLLHIAMDYMDHKLVMRNTQFFWKTSYFCGQTGYIHFTWLVFFCSNEKQCVHKLVLIETTCQIFNALMEQVFHQ